jgi:hypothetical protein
MTAEPYIDLVNTRCEARFRGWLEQAWAGGAKAFAAAFAGAGRRLGETPVEPTAEEAQRIREAGLRELAGWPLEQVARVALLMRAVERTPLGEQPALLSEVFARGANAERQAVLRALPMLPGPARFLETAIEACRTNVRTVFEAIACENPFPAAYFPEPAFNQMLLKALFVGVNLERIQGWQARITPELQRMAADYASERSAAGRSVPSDIALITRDRGRTP